MAQDRNRVRDIHRSVVIGVRGVRADRLSASSEEKTESENRVGDVDRPVGVHVSTVEDFARAAELSGQDSFELDQLLTDVSESIRKYNELHAELSIKQSELNGLIKLYKVKSDTLSAKRKQFEKEAKEEARTLLTDVNKEVERVIREIKESAADKQVVK